MLILLRVDGLDHGDGGENTQGGAEDEGEDEEEGISEEDEEEAEKMGRMMKIMKKWRKVLMENGKVIMITMEALTQERR